MRRWLLLLTSIAGLAQAAPPARIEIAYEVRRDGSVVAEVVEVLEHGGGRYQITETSKGKGLLAFAGTIKRTSRGLADADGVRPLEYLDERPGRNSRRSVRLAGADRHDAAQGQRRRPCRCLPACRTGCRSCSRSRCFRRRRRR